MSSTAVKPYFSPFDKCFVDEPFSAYQQLREYGPIYQDDALGYYVISRYDEVKQAVLDTEHFSSAKGVFMALDKEGRLVEDSAGKPIRLLEMDPPMHSQFRALVSRAFNTKQMAALQPLVQSISDTLIEKLITKDEIDFNKDYANVLPVTVICDMLGCEQEHRIVFKNAADALVRQIGSQEGQQEARAEFLAVLSEQVEKKKKAPDDALISALLAASIDGQSLSPQELLGFIGLLMGAGTETTTNLITNAMAYMQRHPEVKQRLRNDPSKIPGAVEEFLRLESPVQGMARTVTKEVTIGGTTFPKGAKVLLLAAAANRDPDAFEQPDVFDENRTGKKSLALGHGIHLCLGAHLARLEARIALHDLLAKASDYEVQLEDATRTQQVLLRGYETLPAKRVG